jgi:hypothetical protein
MLRLLIILMVTVNPLTSGYAQSSAKPKAQYVAGNGRCGPLYRLADAPVYFYNPKTHSEILDVIQILRSAPPGADVQCHDFTDTWSPYLYADRKVRIASLLTKLKRYDEARDELWSLYLRDGVLYRGRKLYYSMGKDRAIALLMSDELWSVEDIERRLKDSRYDYVEKIKAAYEQRRASTSTK